MLPANTDLNTINNHVIYKLNGGPYVNLPDNDALWGFLVNIGNNSDVTIQILFSASGTNNNVYLRNLFGTWKKLIELK